MKQLSVRCQSLHRERTQCQSSQRGLKFGRCHLNAQCPAWFQNDPWYSAFEYCMMLNCIWPQDLHARARITFSDCCQLLDVDFKVAPLITYCSGKTEELIGGMVSWGSQDMVRMKLTISFFPFSWSSVCSLQIIESAIFAEAATLWQPWGALRWCANKI